MYIHMNAFRKLPRADLSKDLLKLLGSVSTIALIKHQNKNPVKRIQALL